MFTVHPFLAISFIFVILCSSRGSHQDQPGCSDAGGTALVSCARRLVWVLYCWTAFPVVTPCRCVALGGLLHSTQCVQRGFWVAWRIWSCVSTVMHVNRYLHRHNMMIYIWFLRCRIWPHLCFCWEGLGLLPTAWRQLRPRVHLIIDVVARDNAEFRRNFLQRMAPEVLEEFMANAMPPLDPTVTEALRKPWCWKWVAAVVCNQRGDMRYVCASWCSRLKWDQITMSDIHIDRNIELRYILSTYQHHASMDSLCKG